MTAMLLLVPTPIELSHIDPIYLDKWKKAGIRTELIGFGQIVAAVRTSSLIATYSPTHVLLLGIAGSLSHVAPVGTAIRFTEVLCHGIGVGEGEHYQPSSEMGWMQWAMEPVLSDSILLNPVTSGAQHSPNKQLLSSTTCSNSVEEANRRRRLYPIACAEDMEGFGVAAACKLSSTPMTVIRGISNECGDRDLKKWQIKKAMDAAVALAMKEGLL